MLQSLRRCFWGEGEERPQRAAGSTRSTNQAETDRPRYAARGSPSGTGAQMEKTKPPTAYSGRDLLYGQPVLAPWVLPESRVKPRVIRVAGINVGEHSRRRGAMTLPWINLARIYPHSVCFESIRRSRSPSYAARARARSRLGTELDKVKPCQSSSISTTIFFRNPPRRALR